MTTKQTVLNYYSAIHAENWQDYISDKLAYGFNSAEQNLGKQDYLQGAEIFLMLSLHILWLKAIKRRLLRATLQSPPQEPPRFLRFRNFSQCETAKLLPPASILTAPPLWPL